MPFEVELKFHLPDPEAFRLRLCELQARGGAIELHHDWYFKHPTRDFATTDEALRIRRIDGCSWLTYKGPKLDQTTKTRQEYEVKLSTDPKAADTLTSILQAIGMEPVFEIRKQREPFHLAWRNCDIEVTIDTLPELGTFAELECQLVSDSPMDVVEELTRLRTLLNELATSLGLRESIRQSYLEMMLHHMGYTTSTMARKTNS